VNVAQIAPLADTWGMHGDVGAGWMILMMVVMVLFWAAVVFGVVWLIRSSYDGRPAPRVESPMEILERRFAEGAISVEDYRARREVLLARTPPASNAQDDERLIASGTATGS
jgi:putative membrane protein